MRKFLTLVVLVALTPACSFLGMTPTPNPVPKDVYPRCTDNTSTITTDGVLTSLGALILIGIIKDNASPEAMLIVGVPTAAFAGSLIYGEVERRSCVEARAEGDRILLPPYRSNP